MSEDKFKELAGEESAESEGIARLEEENAKLKDRIKEERFLWFVLITIVFDAWLFPSMQTWGGPVSILVLELIILLILARRLGVNEVQILIDRILGAFGKRPGDS